VLTRLRNRAAARLLEWRSQKPYVRRWHDGPLLVLPGVLDPVATKVGEWLADAVDAGPGERWLDMGCGTGVVGLALGERGVHVVCADIDPACVRNARANAALRNLAVDVVSSDLFAAVPGDFDGAVYNVPFWPGEPRGRFGNAFYAGDDFRAVRTWVAQAPARSRRVLVALSEAGTAHADARAALGAHRVLKRERFRSEWLVLCELDPPRRPLPDPTPATVSPLTG
jgi:methylase of polypeptide subunit release factors